MLVAAGLVVSTIVAHYVQSTRLARLFRVRADSAMATGNIPKALRCLRGYAQCRWDDPEAVAEFALLLAQAAQTPWEQREAAATLQIVLDRLPSRDDLRRALVEVFLKLEKPHEAEAHLNVLRNRDPHDARVSFLLGRCRQLQGRYQEAVASYRAALRADPAHLPARAALARLLRYQLGRPAEADGLVEASVGVVSDSADVFRFRATYWRDCGEIRKAAENARESLRRAPDDLETVLLTADLFARPAARASRSEIDQLMHRLEALTAKQSPR